MLKVQRKGLQKGWRGCTLSNLALCVLSGGVGPQGLSRGPSPGNHRHVSHSYAGEYQADEQAGVARLRWRVSGI